MSGNADVRQATGQTKLSSRLVLQSTSAWTTAVPAESSGSGSPVRPNLSANRVRLATVAARCNWHLVLARPKYLA